MEQLSQADTENGTDTNHGHLYESEGEEMEQQLYYDLYFSEKPKEDNVELSNAKDGTLPATTKIKPSSVDPEMKDMENPTYKSSLASAKFSPTNFISNIFLDTESTDQPVTYVYAKGCENDKMQSPSKISQNGHCDDDSDNVIILDSDDGDISINKESTPIITNASKKRKASEMNGSIINNKSNKKPITRKRFSFNQTSEFVEDLSDDENDNCDKNSAKDNSDMVCNISTNFCNDRERLEYVHLRDVEEARKTNVGSKVLRTDWPLDYTEGRNFNNRTSEVGHWTPHMTTFYDSDFSDDFDMKTILDSKSREYNFCCHLFAYCI